MVAGSDPLTPILDISSMRRDSGFGTWFALSPVQDRLDDRASLGQLVSQDSLSDCGSGSGVAVWSGPLFQSGVFAPW